MPKVKITGGTEWDIQAGLESLGLDAFKLKENRADDKRMHLVTFQNTSVTTLTSLWSHSSTGINLPDSSVYIQSELLLCFVNRDYPGLRFCCCFQKLSLAVGEDEFLLSTPPSPLPWKNNIDIKSKTLKIRWAECCFKAWKPQAVFVPLIFPQVYK